MENKNREVKNLKSLEDLASLNEGDIVKMEIGGNTSLEICYKPLKGVNYPNGKLKFLSPTSLTEEEVVSLYVPKEIVSVEDNTIKVTNQKDITSVYSYKRDPMDHGRGYENKRDIIKKAGF